VACLQAQTFEAKMVDLDTLRRVAEAYADPHNRNIFLDAIDELEQRRKSHDALKAHWDQCYPSLCALKAEFEDPK
jgi:hypothetical protein